MFDNVSFRKDEKGIVTIKGLFGNRFSKLLEKNILSKDRLKQLFINYSALEISFHEFFSLEVRVILGVYKDLPYRKNEVVIENAIKSITENTWLINEEREFGDTFDYDIVKSKMVYEILPHQKEWFSEYYSSKKRHHRRGRLLAAAPGTGKSYMSLALAELVLSDKIIVICPSQAIETVWHKSLNEDLYKQPQVFYSSIRDTKYNGERFALFHYEALPELIKLVRELKGKGTTIIIDESHNLNENTSKRTNLMIKACKEIGSDNIMLLSGSPIKAVPMEMLPMIEVLDIGFDPIIKNRFIKLYKSMPKVLKPAIKERFTGYRTYIPKDSLELPPIITESINIRLKNAKEYTLENIKKKMIKYAEDRIKELTDNFDKYQTTYDTLYEKAKDKLTFNDMKPKDFEVYEVSIKKIKAAYRDNRLMFITDILAYANKFEKETIIPALDTPEEKKLFKEAKTIVKYLKLKIQGEILGLVVGRERVNCHRDMASVIDYKSLINSTTQKTIVFSNYIEVCDVAYDKISKIGYQPLKVYGSDTKFLNHNVNKFSDKTSKDNPMVTTYKSLSTAVPLIVANVAIMLDLPFRSYIYDQASARLQRLGQKAKNIFIYQIHLDTGDIPNINSRNIDIIEWSKQMVEDITGHSANVEIIKNEGTDEGKKTVIMDEIISSFYKLNLSKEEKKEISILDAW